MARSYQSSIRRRVGYRGIYALCVITCLIIVDGAYATEAALAKHAIPVRSRLG